MNAWKRCSFGACGLLAALLALGCKSNDGKAELQRKDKEPVARVPSWNSSGEGKTAEPEVLPETHFSAGKMHESQGHLARAAEQYHQAISLKPNYVEAYNRLGIVLDQLRRYKEADEAFARAIELQPNAAYLHNNAAFSYLMQSRWPDAQAELTRALELHPEFLRARVNLGLVLAQQERFDEAREQFERALPRADAYFNLGLMYQSKQRLADAARAFKTALALDPKMVAAQKHLAVLPADAVSGVEADTSVLASPQARVGPVDRAPDQGQRPSSQPAKTESPGADTNLTPSGQSALPPCLDLSIQTRTDSLDYDASGPPWLLLEPSPMTDGMFGPPAAEPYANAAEGSPCPPQTDQPAQTPQDDDPASSDEP